MRVLDRQKFPSRNFLSPRLPQKRNWNKVYLFLFSFPFPLWAVLITNLYNVAMNWINWLNYMTNVTIHRQPTLFFISVITVFDFQIQIMPNFLYPEYIFFIFLNTDLLFWAENSKLRISPQKHFHFLLLSTSRKRKLISAM